MVVLNECFDVEGNVAILHFNDGSELMIDNKPHFFNSHMGVDSSYDVYGETVDEQFIIPFSSVLYITLSNVRNLKILSNQYAKLKKEID